MYKASYVMYSIANFFTWVIVLIAISGAVASILGMTNAVPDLRVAGFGVGHLIICIVVLIVSFITIALVRKAKAKNTSKGWDVLFLILGIFGSNIFYILGGIFGLCANK